MKKLSNSILLSLSLVVAAEPVLAQGIGQNAGQDSGLRIGGRDFRQGDGTFNRQQRLLRGGNLHERTRLNRQERLIESRQDRIDEARWRRGSGQIDVEGLGFGQRHDSGAEQRQDRATQAERSAQARARAKHRELAREQYEARQKSSADRRDR